MITLLALLLRLVLLLVFTFGFVVLYEHGPAGFATGLATEAGKLVTDFTKGTVKTETEVRSVPAESPAPTPEVSATPAEPAPPAPASEPNTNAPSAWKDLQSRPIGGGIDAPVGGVKAE